MTAPIARKPEPELMDLPAEVHAYAVADFSAVNQLFTARLMEIAGAHETAQAVDLGTGPGDIPIRVANARPGWRIRAVDASAPMLDVARAAIAQAGLARNIELVLADAKDTRLPAGSFDVIFSNSILHHVSSPAAFWRELRRIALPGASVLLRDLARPPSEERARELVKQNAGGESALLQEEFFRSLLSAYTVEEVRAQLAAAGLDMLRVAMISDRHLDVFGTLQA